MATHEHWKRRLGFDFEVITYALVSSIVAIKFEKYFQIKQEVFQARSRKKYHYNYTYIHMYVYAFCERFKLNQIHLMSYNSVVVIFLTTNFNILTKN